MATGNGGLQPGWFRPSGSNWTYGPNGAIDYGGSGAVMMPQNPVPGSWVDAVGAAGNPYMRWQPTSPAAPYGGSSADGNTMFLGTYTPNTRPQWSGLANGPPPAAPSYGAAPQSPTRTAAAAPMSYSYGLPPAPANAVAAPPQPPAANPLSAAIRRPSSSYVATPAAASSVQGGWAPDERRRRPFPAAPG